jgi:hypothetical protein
VSFVVRGPTRDGRSAEVTWYPPAERRKIGWHVRGPVGDAAIVSAVVVAEVEGRWVAATPTGPSYLVDLDEPVPAMLAIAELLRTGYQVEGELPAVEYELPAGAIP